MGVFSYVVVANLDDAEELLGAADPLERFPGYGEKALDPARWAALARVIGFEPSSAQQMIASAPLAQREEDEGPWVFGIPPELLARVGQVQSTAIDTIARAWVDADRIIALGGVDYAREALRRLIDVAQRAIAEKRTVLVRCEL
jgi:hypothetical protein